MTDERKNEIWAMLPEVTKADCRRIFMKESFATSSSYGQGYRDALIDFFGKHNLTAQAEEKPKEPKFRIDDKVLYNGKLKVIQEVERSVDGYYRYQATTISGLSPLWFTESELVPWVSASKDANFDTKDEPKAKELANSFQYNLDYRQYRLDLTKEIALKVANNRTLNVAKFAADTANEIVKRLKETEI